MLNLKRPTQELIIQQIMAGRAVIGGRAIHASTKEKALKKYRERRVLRSARTGASRTRG